MIRHKEDEINVSGRYVEVGTKKVDKKCRVTIGEPLAEAYGVNRVKVYKNVTDGSILLVPVIEIPANEQWLYKNKKALRMVLQGLKEAKEGRGRKLDLRELKG